MAKVKLKKKESKVISNASSEIKLKSKPASDTLFVSSPKDKRLKSYQDSLGLYNLYKKGIPKGSFNYRKYKPEKSAPISGKKNGVDVYSGMEDPFAKDPIKPVRKYDFYRTNEAAYINGVYYPPQGEALSSGYLYKKPVQPVKYKKQEPKKPEPKKEEPEKKNEIKPVEKKQNVYEGTPVYSPGAGSGMPSALVGFMSKGGDTTYIKPEDYERFAVPEYGKRFIQSKINK
jgi:hypothetical protein